MVYYYHKERITMPKDPKKKSKRKIKWKNIFLLLVVFVGLFFIIKFFQKGNLFDFGMDKGYIAGTTVTVEIYDIEGKEVERLSRGKEVKYSLKDVIKTDDGKSLYKIAYGSKVGYVDKASLTKDYNKVVKETDVYVRTPQNLYSAPDDGTLLGLVRKGELLEVLGFDMLNEDGTVNMYKVKSKEEEGYIYSKYVVLDEASSLANYEPEKYYDVHAARGDNYGGGSGGSLDYYPVEKPIFENNPMPKEVYALYLNCSPKVINSVDDYIAFAKETKINSFVVDIKDNETSAYPAEAMKKYSMTNYEKAFNTKEAYQQAIKKIKDAGFYVIGRITVFKDKYYAMDHQEHSLMDSKTGDLFLHYNTYWPSPYQRTVWQFNVELAKESVKEMGFQEIQFDYVRFPDRTKSLETAGAIDFRNVYQEEKAQAIQRFLQYATDELHKLGVYVSADVFGESAHSYVTAYGQYFPAISNVVDVISAMPYPDHFSKYEYGFKQPVWTVPYEILNYWGENYVQKRQSEIPTPAIVRTWVQTYDTIHEPYVTYGSKEVEAQIQGLYDAGLNGGYMTWNSGSNLEKYRSQANAYKKEY